MLGLAFMWLGCRIYVCARWVASVYFISDVFLKHFSLYSRITIAHYETGIYLDLNYFVLKCRPMLVYEKTTDCSGELHLS